MNSTVFDNPEMLLRALRIDLTTNFEPARAALNGLEDIQLGRIRDAFLKAPELLEGNRLGAAVRDFLLTVKTIQGQRRIQRWGYRP